VGKKEQTWTAGAKKKLAWENTGKLKKKRRKSVTLAGDIKGGSAGTTWAGWLFNSPMKRRGLGEEKGTVT